MSPETKQPAPGPILQDPSVQSHNLSEKPPSDGVPPMPQNQYYGVTASSWAMAAKNQRLPVGLYLVAAWSFVGFATSFFNSSQTSMVYTVVMLLDLLLAIGLVLRIEVARKALVVLLGITVVLSIVACIMLALLQNAVARQLRDYNGAVAQLSSQSLTTKQRDSLATLQEDITQKEKQLGKTVPVVYATQVFNIISGSIIVIYLTRYKTRAIFAP